MQAAQQNEVMGAHKGGVALHAVFSGASHITYVHAGWQDFCPVSSILGGFFDKFVGSTASIWN